MRKLLLLTTVVAMLGSTGCYYHPFQRGYTCAPPVYSQPTYAPPTAVPAYAPACQPVVVQQCPCN